MSRHTLPPPEEIERQAQRIAIIKLDRRSRCVQLLFDNGEAAMTRYTPGEAEMAVLLTQQMAAVAGMIAIEGHQNALYLKPGRLFKLTVDDSSLIVDFHSTTAPSIETIAITAKSAADAAQLRTIAIRDLAAATLAASPVQHSSERH